MGKKELVIQAEKYLTTDLLYGTISSGAKKTIRVKDMIEANADRIVKDGWTEENVAANIRKALFDRETEEPIFTYAHDVALPLEPVITTPESQREYVEEFISSLPYKGDIRTGIESTDIINIESEIRNIANTLTNDNKILFADKEIGLKDYYKKLLAQEVTPPMLTDKVEAIMSVVGNLRQKYPDFDELAQTRINGRTFLEFVKELPKIMTDSLDVQDRLVVKPLDEYMMEEFERVSEYEYNSVNSKPSNVELIGVEYSKDHRLTVTSEYIFLSPDEEESLKAEFSPLTDDEFKHTVHSNILLVIDGINKARELDTLAKYEKSITKIGKEIKTRYPNDELLNGLFPRLLQGYDRAYKNLSFISKNDDIGYMVSQDLKDAKIPLKDYTRDFSRTLEADKPQKQAIMYQFDSIKRSAYDMGIQGLHHELDEVEDEISKINAIEYGLNNVNHDEVRVANDIEYLKMNIDKESRAYDQATDPKAKATHQIAVGKFTKDLNRVIDSAAERGLYKEPEGKKIT